MTFRPAATAAFLALSACSGVQPQPADPAAVQRIVQACTASGLFKTVSGLALAAVPAGPLAASVLAAGVDRVCVDPNRFAADLSTAEWVARNLAAESRALLGRSKL